MLRVHYPQIKLMKTLKMYFYTFETEYEIVRKMPYYDHKNAQETKEHSIILVMGPSEG